MGNTAGFILRTPNDTLLSLKAVPHGIETFLPVVSYGSKHVTFDDLQPLLATEFDIAAVVYRPFVSAIRMGPAPEHDITKPDGTVASALLMEMDTYFLAMARTWPAGCFTGADHDFYEIVETPLSDLLGATHIHPKHVIAALTEQLIECSADDIWQGWRDASPTG